MVLLWLTNKTCTCFAGSKIVRKIGIAVHSNNYFHDFVASSFKLFLESYFDIVICTMLNLVSFKRSKNVSDFAEFFGTRDDAVCSTITIVYTIMILFFPFYVYKVIRSYEG